MWCLLATGPIKRLDTNAIANKPAIAYIVELYNVEDGSAVPLGTISIKFDIVTAFDVIEHVESPVNFLNMIKKYLKKNGIVLIYTPNKNSLGFKLVTMAAVSVDP